MALSVKRKYTRRTEFAEYLKVPFDALCDIYKPSYFSRVGLRYVDIIRRSALGLVGHDWDELLQPYALWMLYSPIVKSRIQTFASQCEIRLDDGDSIARVVMSLVVCQDGQQEAEECLKIDTDFYVTKRTQVSDIQQRLDYFHKEGLRLFRWLITDNLHTAMGPEEIPNG